MNNLAARRAGHRSPAFTLIEMLVSMTVLALLSTFLFGMLNFVNTAWSRAQAETEPHRNGRAILDMIARDLRPAALPSDRTNVSNTSLQFLIDPTSVTATYRPPHAFFWQAPIATDTTYGDLAEVGYFVQWDATTNPSNPRARLCRFFANPLNPTSPSTTSPPYLIYTASASTTPNWVTDAILKQYAPGDATSNYQDWVADNVLSLWVRALDATGSPIVKTASGGTVNATDLYAYDSRQGYTDINSNVVSGTTTQPMAALPASIEVAVVMIDSQTAGLVTTNLSPASISSSLAQNPANFWPDLATYQSKLPAFVQKSVSVYSTRIPLANAK